MLRKVDISAFDPEQAGDENRGIFGLPFSEGESNLVLLPVPWEVTTSYGRGTAQGPAAIRRASPQLDLFDPELAVSGLPHPWQYGIHMRDADPEVVRWNAEASDLAVPIIQAGGCLGSDPEATAQLEKVNAHCRALDQWVEEQTAALLDAEKIVGIVGGDHSVALGSIAAHAAHHGAMGVLHVDAHADLRVSYEGFERSHASVMHNVLERVSGIDVLVQVGVRDLSEQEYARTQDDSRVVTYFDHSLRRRLHAGEPWRRLCEEIVDHLPPRVYVSFDIDGLEPAYCPHTGTPVPGGLGFGHAMTLLSALLWRNKTVVGFDLVEVAPGPEGSTEIDANVGARILYRLGALALLGRLSG